MQTVNQPKDFSHDQKEALATLNALLRGELSAVETYRIALDKIGDEAFASEIRRLEGEHRESVSALRVLVVDMGGTPDTDSGAWGTWAKAVEGTAALLGDTAALKALKEGEEHGIKEYHDALEGESLDAESRELIRGQLLPKCEAHVGLLDRFIDAKPGAFLN